MRWRSRCPPPPAAGFRLERSLAAVCFARQQVEVAVFVRVGTPLSDYAAAMATECRCQVALKPGGRAEGSP
ncbi:MAG: hypothetical protein R3F11_25870 [Verrucomicrobiales bacterium]